jgi:transcriptional regulator with XRE-family HTH domain
LKHRYTRCHQRLMAELTRVREMAQLSQRDLSTKLKRTHSFAYYIEGGHRSISVCEFIEWVVACDADPAQVMRRIASD